MRKGLLATILATASAMAVASGCRATRPGTAVEAVEKGGQKVYVAGGAGPGYNEEQACTRAIQKAVFAVALEFAQDFDDIGDEVAEELGASDGQVFLEKYAKHEALEAPVDDITFDPVDHLCMATVRWVPPVFVKEAVLKFGERMKAAEMAQAAGPQPAPAASGAPAPAAAAGAPPAAGAAPPAASAPPPPASVAPPAAAAPVATAPACTREKSALAKVLRSSQKAIDDFNKCLGKTSGDETICHRYKLYVEKASKNEAAAGQGLTACLNQGLSTTVRMSLSKNLPGHAAVSVETRGDGTLVLWTFSPVDQTSFAYEMTTAGSMAGRTPLAANQVSWLKQQLGL